MPEIEELWERYAPRGADIVMVSDEGADVLEPYLRERGYAFPAGADEKKEAVRAFGVQAWPKTYVIDADGRIAYAGSPEFAKRAQETVGDAQLRAQEYLGKGREVVEEKSAQLRAAFEAGRSAMRDEISKLRAP